jgi:hypothetical protein
MEALFKLMVVDEDYSKELFDAWSNSYTQYNYITWLKIHAFNNTMGGADKNHVIKNQKLLAVLINELEKQN